MMEVFLGICFLLVIIAVILFLDKLKLRRLKKNYDVNKDKSKRRTDGNFKGRDSGIAETEPIVITPGEQLLPLSKTDTPRETDNSNGEINGAVNFFKKLRDK